VLEQYVLARRGQRDVLLMTHIVIGYPSFEDSMRTVSAMVEAGVDIIELQMPFSEPIADGPVILHANQKALAGATVERCILDKRVRIGTGARVGAREDGRPNEEQPEVLSCGITMIGKDARIPAHQRLGTNCLIDMLIGADDFPKRTLPDGTALRTNRVHHPVR